MRINSLWMKNFSKDIELSEISLSKINLLVGMSGVGKTQILSAVYNLRKIIKEDTAGLYGVQWRAGFSVRTGANTEGFAAAEMKNYLWEGSFSPDKGNGHPIIERETLTIDGKNIFTREGSDSTFNGVRLPKISGVKSMLSIFAEDGEIRPAIGELLQIHYMSNEGDSRKTVPYQWIREHKGRFASEVELIDSDYELINKFALSYELDHKIFGEIKEDYIDVFPQVEDVRFEINREDHTYYISIKEKSSDWIPQQSISSGMYKTLLYIAEMKLLRSESVVLIDEFENSLGINCIHIVADIITRNERNMQFIITSHHPYIINNIDLKNWKVVMRDGTFIYTKAAEELNLGKSKHEFFKQLINSKEYISGIS